jgi:acetyltransferase-like isoleucine patch superfamily enzyme
MIGGGTLISGVEHGYARRDIPMRHQPPESKPVRIEDDVWIGMGVKLLPGVTIGKGAIIGAGSVVTRSIPAYSIAIGAPCRVVRER